MQTRYLIPSIFVSVMTVLAIIVYIYRTQISEMLGSPISGNVLLIILITVDGLGGALVPFLVYKAEQRERQREKTEAQPVLSIEHDEKGEPSTFAPALRLIAQDGTPTGITQKYLRVRIRNTGGVARRCKAQLRVVKEDTPFRTPSPDPKPLVWGGPSLEKDIGARNGAELLHVVFSDSQFSSVPPSTQDKNIYALVSTWDSLYPSGDFIRAQDGFGEGSFKVELDVISEEGASAKSTFRIHVDRDFTKLSMERIS